MKMKTHLALLLAALALALAGCTPGAAASASSAASSAAASASSTASSGAASADSAAQTTSAASAAEPTATGLTFTTTALDGSAADQRIFAGHTLTMMNAWGTFCDPCLKEMPELAELAADYADKGVQVVGVVWDVRPGSDGAYPESDLATARELVAETGASYPHLLYSQELNAALPANMVFMPTTFFVDETGNVVGEAYVGARSGADWAALLDAALAEVAK